MLNGDERLARLQRRDGDAWRRWVQERSERAIRVARRITGNDADAEEASQDAFVSAFRSIERFDGRSALDTWQHRIVVNAALARVRGRKRRKEETLEPDDDTSRASSIAADLGHDPHERGDLSRTVRRALDTLPDEHRAVLVLRDVEGYSSEEVAEAMGLSDANVRQRLHRARKTLAEILRPELCGDGELTCGGDLDLLLDHLDGALDAPLVAPVRAHVEMCPTCGRLASIYATTIAAPASAPWPVDRDALDRVVARVVASLREGTS